MTVDPSHLFERIVAALRAMDAEALPVDGKPTGLNWYGGWARPDLRRPHTEVEWTKSLAKRLGCHREVRYPADPRIRCDLVDDGCWIEVKGLWPAYWEGLGKRTIYEAYLFDPLKPYPSLGKSHTAARDIVKLARLSPEVAPAVGLVLVGFDSDAKPCDADIGELARLAQLGRWWHGSARWPDPNLPGQSVKVWGWFEAGRAARHDRRAVEAT
jgi:hypothetical protein